MLVANKLRFEGNTASCLGLFTKEFKDGIMTFSIDDCTMNEENLKFFTILHLMGLLGDGYISTTDDQGNVVIIENGNSKLYVELIRSHDDMPKKISVFHDYLTMRDLVSKIVVTDVDNELSLDEEYDHVIVFETITLSVRFKGIVERQECTAKYYPNLMHLDLSGEDPKDCPNIISSSSFKHELYSIIKELSDDGFESEKRIVIKSKHNGLKIKGDK